MATLTNVLKESSPTSQMKPMTNMGKMTRPTDGVIGQDIVFNPTQRLDNQLKTASQVMNYTASKSLAEQNRTLLGGDILGYSETLG